MSIDPTAPIYNSEEAAREHLEAIRWPHGPYCPHCGEAEAITKLKGKSTRPGVYKCRSCRKPFSVTVGTLFERSKIPLHKWVLATHLLCASKKGMSAHQLHRMLNVTYKTAWFMAHRLRESMRDPKPTPMGGHGKAIEADETYFGPTEEKTSKGRKGPANKRAVLALVERSGSVRTFHIEKANAQTVRDILVKNASRKSDLLTDESRLYHNVGKEYASHKRSNHSSGRYVEPDGTHTNTVENYFSIFKCGMKGVYQHCGEKHLHRYLAEFDYRYSTRKIEDNERAAKALHGITGRRLTYRRIGEGAEST